MSFFNLVEQPKKTVIEFENVTSQTGWSTPVPIVRSLVGIYKMTRDFFYSSQAGPIYFCERIKTCCCSMCVCSQMRKECGTFPSESVLRSLFCVITVTPGKLLIITSRNTVMSGSKVRPCCCHVCDYWLDGA